MSLSLMFLEILAPAQFVGPLLLYSILKKEKKNFYHDAMLSKIIDFFEIMNSELCQEMKNNFRGH